ncbi:hypothetical protein [Micromonospora sp. NPDC092111]|uniref:hypothetical protein n=1 Tax=Micromonospora sp. NPDC092111 TaxID=3364289 RepID=UPI00381DB7B9
MAERIDGRVTVPDHPYWVAAVREARAALAEANARMVEAEHQRRAVTTTLETALACLYAATTSARFALADARDRQRPARSDPGERPVSPDRYGTGWT